MQTFRFLFYLLTLVGALTITCPASATLGEDFLPESIKQAKLASSIRMMPWANYTVNEYTLASGTVVRELVSSAHKVFAVGWSGPFKPDFRQLLGTHFDRYVAASRKKSERGRHPVSLRDANLVIHATGHMRAFFGIVYLPDQMPAGLTEDDLQ